MATSPAPLETRVAQCLAYIRSQVSEKPEVAIICGSGLGGLADVIESPVSLDYKDIPHFHASSVPGHAGKLVFGTLGGKQVVAMKGRFHFYEGYPASTVAFPVRVFAALGAKALMVTNAAGGISAHLNVGDVMIIRDHIYVPGLGELAAWPRAALSCESRLLGELAAHLPPLRRGAGRRVARAAARVAARNPSSSFRP